jgi:hypothetical protein
MTKSAFETHCVAVLVDRAQLFAAWHLQGSDRPDVDLILPDGRWIGVEVTQLFRDAGPTGSPDRAVIGLLEQVCCSAVEVCNDRGISDLHVSISRAAYSRLDRSRCREIGGELVDIVSRLCHPGPGTRLREDDDDNLLPSGIGSVSAIRVPQLEHSHWGLTGAGWVAPTSHDLFQQAMDQKEPKRPSYRAGAYQYWLLLVWDWSVHSSMSDIHPTAATEAYHSSFDRVFVLDLVGRHWTELRVSSELQA